VYTNNNTIFKQLTHYFDDLICKCERYNTRILQAADVCLEVACMSSVRNWYDRLIFWKVYYDLCLRYKGKAIPVTGCEGPFVRRRGCHIF
jgi:hypothetical protein